MHHLEEKLTHLGELHPLPYCSGSSSSKEWIFFRVKKILYMRFWICLFLKLPCRSNYSKEFIDYLVMIIILDLSFLVDEVCSALTEPACVAIILHYLHIDFSNL